MPYKIECIKNRPTRLFLFGRFFCLELSDILLISFKTKRLENKVNKYTVSDIEFGRTDGKSESMSIDNFEEMFYDGDGFYEKLKTPETFIILGRKGMGKTILASYFLLQMNKRSNSMAEMITATSLLESKLKLLDYSSIDNQEFKTFWDFVLLKKFANLILKGAAKTNNKKIFKIKAKQQKNLIAATNSDNFSAIEMETNEKSNARFSLSAKGSQVSGGIQDGQTVKYTRQYYQYIDQLRESVFDILKDSKKSYYVIIDDLDELATRGFSDDYVTAINALLDSVRLMNENFRYLGLNTKIIVTLREDMNEALQENSDNLAKYVDDSAIKLKWFSVKGTKPWDLDITKMVLKKIGVSLKMENTENEQLLRRFFSVYVDKKTRTVKCSQIDFILERTFGRPRDFIQLLRKYASVFPDDTKFVKEHLQTVYSAYANDFMSELKNELHIAKNRGVVNTLLDDINNLGWREFTLKDLINVRDKQENNSMDLETWKSGLQKLYKTGLVGVVRSGSGMFQFANRDGSPNRIRLDEESNQIYRVHYCLISNYSLVRPPKKWYIEHSEREVGA